MTAVNRHAHWRCAWCLTWNKGAHINCHTCGRDLALLIGLERLAALAATRKADQ